MLTTRFNTLFERLVHRFHGYHDVPRSPATVVQLASARIALDDTRAEIAAEREKIASRRLPSGPLARVSIPTSDLAVLDVQGMISS
ncbi:MAG: hypothetical protein R3258_07100 [Acidimicrobiia bacterium]|nr:hypothetical protein [Acidimicrobiia bacterium]